MNEAVKHPRKPPHYAEYVNHMLRQYVYFHRSGNGPRTPCDALNISCVQQVLEAPGADPAARRMLMEVYAQSGNAPMSEAVANAATVWEVSREKVWEVVRWASRRIAEARGLVDTREVPADGEG